MRVIQPLAARLALLSLINLLVACRLDHSVDRVTDTINNAIQKLDTQSSQWQGTLSGLEKDLVSQSQSALAVEVRQLAERGIASGGVELRCDADFVGRRMEEGLTRILAKYQKQDAAPLEQYFCQVSPTQIDLTVLAERSKEVDFYGYNLDAAEVHVTILDKNGRERAIEAGNISTPTHYLLVVNTYVGNGIKFDKNNDKQLVFQINKGKDIHAVNIVANPTKVASLVGPLTKIEIGGVTSAASGAYFETDCPEGYVGTGFVGRSGAAIDALGLKCNYLNSDRSIGAGTILPQIGGGGGTPVDQQCPGALVGVSGFWASSVTRLVGKCTDVSRVIDKTGGPNAEIGGWGFTTGQPYATACPSGYLLVGIYGHSGALVNGLGLVCRMVSETS